MNQAVSFGLLFGGGILLVKSLTGSSFADVFAGRAGPVPNTGQGVASTGVAGVGTALTGAGGGSLTGAPARVKLMSAAAKSLVGKPYVWGGGHSGWATQLGYDCSGFVSAVLHAGGYLSSPQTTQTLPTASGIAAGPGQWVTIYDKTDGGTPATDHVIIDIAGQWFESGGGAGSNNPTGGVSAIPAPSAGYLAEFNRLLHPVGL